MTKREESILGVKVSFGYNLDEVVRSIEGIVDEGSHGNIVCTTNPEFIVISRKDPEFREIINNSRFSFPDGSGILMAEKYLSEVRKVKGKRFFALRALGIGIVVGIKSILNTSYLESPITGSDMIVPLCRMCADKGYNVFFLGGWPKNILGKMKNVDYDLAEKVSEVISKELINLNVIGSTSQFSGNKSDDVKSENFVNKSMKSHNVESIDVLFISYGSPTQEKWLKRNLEKINIKVGIGVGGGFDFVSGDIQRAPNIMKKLHVEWLFRLVSQPWRIKRVLTAVFVFPYFIYKESVKE
jgi:N-acetylglucosaminyldiphosphoundecaprenol N-acetyl-beta-D-mannosaminyltransferase